MHALHLFGLVAGQVQSGATAVISCNLLKNVLLLAPDIELRHVRAGEGTLIACVYQMHQRLWIGISKRLEQNCINDREDSGIRADPDRSHKNRDDRKSWGLHQRSRRKASVAPGGFK